MLTREWLTAERERLLDESIAVSAKLHMLLGEYNGKLKLIDQLLEGLKDEPELSHTDPVQSSGECGDGQQPVG